MGNNENDRIVHHHLQPGNTTGHWISGHNLGKNQKLAIELMHGQCKIKHHDIRFKNPEDFIKFFLELSQRQDTAGIYFVCPAVWKEIILDHYLEKINGTTFGWFVGFGYEDKLYDRKKFLFCRYKHTWLELPIKFNFGKTKEDQRAIKNHFTSNGPSRN